ncbi:MAG: ABC transporter ATP-binding protein [Verrucomicrobiae bacterium]|nr:ABC transporter ATP-binding protein [Verrucomicrobiae bacterium]
MSRVPTKKVLTHVRIDEGIEEQLQQRPFSWGIIARLYAYSKPYAVKRNWLLLFLFCRALQLPLLTWYIAEIISGPIAHGDYPGVIRGALLFLLLAFLTELVYYFRIRYALEFAEGVIHDMRRDLYAHLLRMPMDYYSKTKLGRLISRLTADIEAIRVGVQDVLFISIVQGGQMVLSSLMMIYFQWKLFLIVLCMAPVMFLLNRHFQKVIGDRVRSAMESWSHITATIAESVGGMKVTQSFVRQEENADLFDDMIRRHAHYNVGIAQASGAMVPILEFNTQFFIAALLVTGGWMTLTPEPTMNIGELIQFFFLANLFFNPISVLANQYQQGLSAMAGAERLFHVLDTPPRWEDRAGARTDEVLTGRVEFQDVSFGYDPQKPVLHGVSFVAEPGQTVALVGHTGSGKTSIINLAAKFYLPDSGRILLDGVDLNDITSECLHRQMGIVLQQNFLFTGTVLENIRFARPEASLEEVREAARSLDCLEMIESLPSGFDTPVGERGSSLSIGQRQLVCFVRALLARPRIVILDEATSSVDALTEERLQKALEKLLEGRTAFVIAHRLSTIRNADVVLVLDHGRIIERGTHRELLTLGGTYAHMYRKFVSAL